MYLLVLILPFFSAFLCGIFGKKLGSYGSSQISVWLLFLTFIISLFIFYEVALMGSPCYLKLNDWIISGFFQVEWGLLFDSLTSIMLIVVTSISTLVHLYSTEYMNKDPHLSRFLSYLSLFTLFMLILVTSDNLLQMFLGWEGVGLCSFLLINFWYGRLQANKAALKAMFLNRIGDFGVALSIFLIFYVFKTLDYSIIFSTSYKFSESKILFFNKYISTVDLICLFLFIGAIGKSAQIGLHTWLPDAMEGPTPVSALIHAATMVTAGVFLIARCSPLFEYAPFILKIITILGAITSFFAASTALSQNDLKRVIAYSTCSQLGYMVFACGLSNYDVGIFHLSNHAFFKALLFLSAGSVIHAMSDEQDMRKMGGLINLLPFTYSMFFIGSLALAGFPFLTGFYSKDVILELAYSSYNIEGHFAFWLGSISAFFTAFYSLRLLILTFFNYPEGLKNNYIYIHESPWKMSLPLFILSLGSIFIGFLMKDMMIGLGTDFWGNALFILPKNLNIINAEFLNVYIKLIPSVFSFLGIFFSILLYLSENFIISYWTKNSIGLFIYTFLNRKWFFDKIYNEFISQNILNFSYNISYQYGDRGILELIGPKGISTSFYKKSFIINNIFTGFTFHYLFIIFIILFFIFNLFFFWNSLIFFFEIKILLLLILFSYFLINT